VRDGINRGKNSIMMYNSVHRYVWERKKKQNKKGRRDTKKKNKSGNETKKTRKTVKYGGGRMK
jgi:hypothetical protein